jgi:hypothetical protein
VKTTVASPRGLWLGDEAPAWWHRARRLYDSSIRVAAPLDARLVLAAAAVLGRAAHRLHLSGPSIADIAALIGREARGGLSGVGSDISALRYQNRALVSLVQQRGIRILETFIDPGSLDGLAQFRTGPPVVLVTWHLGPAFALGGAFTRVGLRVLIVRRAIGYHTTPNLDVAIAGGGCDARAAVFRQAVARVREGGHVIMAADGLEAGLTAAVPCLGRRVPMARGPFALARITRAPLVPVVARWDPSGRIRIIVGEPLIAEENSPDIEASYASAAARWLDGYLRASPKQLWLCSLRWLLDAAPV